MKQVRFSEHVLFQMRERNIEKRIVLEVVSRPDNHYRQSTGRLVSVKKIFKNGKLYCIVVVTEETFTTARIITTFITSKTQKYLL